MRPLLVVFSVLLSPLASAKGPCIEANREWAVNFGAFMSLMDCASAELAGAQDRGAYLGQLSKALSNARVEWAGTVRAVRGERLYFNESYARIEPDMQAARVMYYAGPKQAGEWQRGSLGQKVHYTGTVAAVKVDTLAARRPLLYIELAQVGRND